MQKFMMFTDIPKTSEIMYPDGRIKTNGEAKEDYPIFKTSIGVIGFTTDSKGTVGDLILMGYYDDINSLVDAYIGQGVEITDEMTNAEKCAVITEFVNNPITEEDEALEAYLNM